MLLNLVGNAIKFTDTGEVSIKASLSEGAFHVAVRDTGPGISPADQAKLFQEFQQADNSTTRRKGGTGLGLAISKRIIEMHGGKIWLESAVGQGSTFYFTIPVRVDAKRGTAAADRPHVVTNVLCGSCHNEIAAAMGWLSAVSCDISRQESSISKIPASGISRALLHPELVHGGKCAGMLALERIPGREVGHRPVGGKRRAILAGDPGVELESR